MNYNNPYYNPTGYNMNYQQMYRQPVQQVQPMMQPIMQQQNFLQGKIVDSIDTMKRCRNSTRSGAFRFFH